MPGDGFRQNPGPQTPTGHRPPASDRLVVRSPEALGHNQVSPSWVPGSGMAAVLEGLVRIWMLRKQIVSVPPARIVKMGRTDAIRP